jgi:hypothetical protein
MPTATDTDPENVNMGFFLPPEMLDGLALKAKALGLDTADYAGRVIRAHLEKNPDVLDDGFSRRQAQ